MSDNDKQFTFFAYKHKLTGPLITGDTNVTLVVDQIERISLAPFVLLDPDTRLEITVKPVEE